MLSSQTQLNTVLGAGWAQSLSLVLILADRLVKYLKMSGDKESDKMADKVAEADSLTKEKPPPAAEQGGRTKESAPSARNASTENQNMSSTNTEPRTGEGGTIGRIISTRSAASDRKAAETALSTALRSLELEKDERNIGVHEVLCYWECWTRSTKLMSAKRAWTCKLILKNLT